MAKRDDILNDKLNRLEDVPDEFVRRIRRVEPSLFDSVLTVLESMKVEQGQLVASAENLNLVDSAIDSLRRTLLGGDYVKRVGDFGNEFDTQKGLSDEYIQLEFDFPSEESALWSRSKRKAIEQLVNVEFVNTGLYDPIRKQLDNAVSSGASLIDTIREIRENMLGTPERRGILQRYAGQIALDSFNQTDAMYMKERSDAIGAEWFQYKGGIIKAGKTSPGTREFCEVRNEKYYHLKDIQAWTTNPKAEPKPVVKWAGQIKGTNEQTIFTFRGGWNCRHQIVPVSEASVPRAILQDAISRGVYSPSAKVRKLRNL